MRPPCRDVLNVLGMYPGDPGPPGSDCAGIIMHAGSAVQGFKPGGWATPPACSLFHCTTSLRLATRLSTHACFLAGDAVFGLAHGCLGTAVVSPAAMLAPMPAVLSFQEAATTPTVFITGASQPLLLLPSMWLGALMLRFCGQQSTLAAAQC